MCVRAAWLLIVVWNVPTPSTGTVVEDNIAAGDGGLTIWPACIIFPFVSVLSVSSNQC